MVCSRTPGMASQVDSGRLGLSPMPNLAWLPNESLYSLCSRYHQLSGHVTSARTCQMLFGSDRVGSSHDIPARLLSLLGRGADLGSVEDIIMHRTLLPFYFPFHDEHECANWIAQCSIGSTGSLKSQLGLAATRYGSAHPLKACSLCISEDRAEHGVAYWHTPHQVPGVLVCLRHKVSLLVCTSTISGQGRFGWRLPENSELTSRWSVHELEQPALNLAEASTALCALRMSFAFDPSRLACMYQSRMKEVGWVSGKACRVDRSRFNKSLTQLLIRTGMASWWPWLMSRHGIPEITDRLLRLCHAQRPRESRHPMNHLPLILLLFDSWHKFWDEYRVGTFDRSGNSYTQDRDVKVHKVAKTRDPVRKQLLQQVASGWSPSRAGVHCGVSVATAMRWMADADMSPPRRPKLLKTPVRSQLIRALSSGIEKTSAAERFNISVTTVTTVLLGEPGLHQRWRDARFRLAQVLARKAWTNVIQTFQTSPSNAWRALQPAAYAWLYRNDRQWLTDSIRLRPQPVPTTGRRRDWQRRDSELSRLIEAAVLSFAQQQPAGRMTLVRLCGLIPELRQKLSALSNLPLTRRAIESACKVTQNATAKAQLVLA